MGIRSGVGVRRGARRCARVPGGDTEWAPDKAPPPTKGPAAFPAPARRLPRPEARGRSLTCGRRSRMPAAWMSSQPTTRRSVSVSVSRPLDMDGVKRSLSSGRRQFSRVMSTPEYSRSPISTPCDPGAVPPEAVVPAAAAGAAGPGAPAPAVAVAVAILRRRLPLGLLPDRAAPRDALRPGPPRPALPRAIGSTGGPPGAPLLRLAWPPVRQRRGGRRNPTRAGAGSLPRRPCGAGLDRGLGHDPEALVAGASPGHVLWANRPGSAVHYVQRSGSSLGSHRSPRLLRSPAGAEGSLGGPGSTPRGQGQAGRPLPRGPARRDREAALLPPGLRPSGMWFRA